MGYISMNKGKWIYPVPWKTGVHFSQKRLQEFIGCDGIKEELKFGILKPKTKTFPLMSGDTVTIPITGGERSKSESHPRYSGITDTRSEPSVSYKDAFKDLQTPNYKYKEDQAKAERKAEREAIIESKRIPEINHFYPAKQLKSLNKQLPKVPRPKKLPPIIKYSPLYIYNALTKPNKQIIKPPKQTPLKPTIEIIPVEEQNIPEPTVVIPQKPSYLKTKLEPIVTSSLPETALKIAIALLVILIPLGFITVGGLIVTALFMPEWLVGGIEYVPKTINTTIINETINTNVPTATGGSGTNPIVVNIPSTPQRPIIVPSTPTPVPSTPTQTKPINTTPQQPSQFKDSKGTVRNINELTSQYTWQINYQCYWDLRDKGFGKGLDVEYVCNSQETGLWMEACTCCKLIGRCQ